MNQIIANNLHLPIKKVAAVIRLLNDGATIPFIARYRKEATGNLDEVIIEKIDNENKKLLELEKRKATIFERLKELNITDQLLIGKIKKSFDPKEVEDLYLPYKPKRVTKASKARDIGLEPLAKLIMGQHYDNIDTNASKYTNESINLEEALQGARDIMAEWISENAFARNKVRRIFLESAVLTSQVDPKKELAAHKYRDYFNFRQELQKIPSHRFLAITRAEKEGFLKVKVTIDEEQAIYKLNKIFVKSPRAAGEQVKLAVKDAIKRLLIPSLKTEQLNEAKERADNEAIETFSKNLKQLLMAAPLGAKQVLALDPGFKTGCKLVCLDKRSNLTEHTTIYPHPPQGKAKEAEETVLKLINKHSIKAIAIGNGTAGRETEQFIKSILPKEKDIEVYLVNEAGASIYSASETGRQEFPKLDLTVRGSISIGRRLIDPLAELVKIEPKSIGVGQYQHDVVQDKLKNSLENTVSFTVNQVGVNLNTASKHLLKFVAGIGPKLADNIVEHRNTNGIFKDRKSLLKVKGLGAKAYEQAAGFLRIKNGKNPLDASAVHPESYEVVDRMAKSIGVNVEGLVQNPALIDNINLECFATPKFGLLTLTDIIQELKKPGLDPRGAAKAFSFDPRIKTIEDLQGNMILPGKVTNLAKFGAFVDIGIKENGLIHISQIADRFIADPSEELKLDQEVMVKILQVDLERKRVQLTLKF